MFPGDDFSNAIIRNVNDQFLSRDHRNPGAFPKARYGTYLIFFEEVIANVQQNPDFTRFEGIFIVIYHGNWLYFEYKVRGSPAMAMLSTSCC